MNTALRKLASVALVMCLTLMGAATWVQVVQADELNAHQNNRRTIWQQLGDTRGPIVVGGVAVAESVVVDDEFGHQRQYVDWELYSSITGFQAWNSRSSTGLERYTDEYLSSDSDQLVLTRIRDVLTGRQPEGAAVETTIVPQVQAAAVAALGDNEGAIVAVEPRTGRILALVSTPAFDPNPLVSHNYDDAAAAQTALEQAPGNPLRSKAYNERYAPGSTFKLITAAAALESGQYSPGSMLYGPRSLELPQTTRQMTNYGGSACDPRSDQISLADSLKVSCNTSFAQLGMDLGEDALRRQAQAFGFDGAQGEVRIPMPVLTSQFPPSGLDPPTMARTAIGQGDVQATPLQMALVSAAIANNGTMMRPYLVDTVRAANLSVISTTKPEKIGQPVSSQTAAQLTSMMELVVEQGSARPGRIDGVRVAAKTGTAQDGSRAPHVWYTGFAPANDPQVAVVVFVKNGGTAGDDAATGGKVAAPMAKQVIEAVLNS
ncbi:MAG: penicillin-binding protein 2 [Micrococcales bacterium]|nr:penicillin-binding protein 2 [Micrococcales bacterium]